MGISLVHVVLKTYKKLHRKPDECIPGVRSGPRGIAIWIYTSLAYKQLHETCEDT